MNRKQAMENLHEYKTYTFPKKKITIYYAIKILKRNRVDVSEEQAKIILNFLNLVAKSYGTGD
jgi:hypothetical protein